MLYLLVFAQVLADRVEVYDGVAYVAFLVPGLVMMTVIQNAYANTSSSLIQAKMNGSINFMLVSPISSLEIYFAYILAAILRGFLVGCGVLFIAIVFVDVPIEHPFVILAFVVLSSALLGTLGMIAGIWADQFEQMAVFQNFVIMPLSFLSGVFYSIHSLPEIWGTLSRFNPFFYMVDGFRYGFLGVSDISPMVSGAIVSFALAVVVTTAIVMLKTGYKLRN
jgi:ABC-2 type transport system permease protein